MRLLDLRTAIGFADEQGRLLRAVSSEGSLFLRIGRVVLMLMVTGDEVELPDDPEDAYACVPERVFLSEREGVLGMERPRKRGDSPWSAQSSVTFVRAHRGPLAVAAELCSDLEMQQGVVVVRTDSGVVRRPVSLGALQRGILIGRYSRCDVGLRGADDSRLSRVHLMIIQDGDELLAVDTASTNGTKYQQREILLKRLEDGDLLRLGGELEIAWHRAA